jgi:hypothetical protein
VRDGRSNTPDDDSASYNGSVTSGAGKNHQAPVKNNDGGGGATHVKYAVKPDPAALGNGGGGFDDPDGGDVGDLFAAFEQQSAAQRQLQQDREAAERSMVGSPAGSTAYGSPLSRRRSSFAGRTTDPASGDDSAAIGGISTFGYISPTRNPELAITTATILGRDAPRGGGSLSVVPVEGGGFAGGRRLSSDHHSGSSDPGAGNDQFSAFNASMLPPALQVATAAVAANAAMGTAAAAPGAASNLRRLPVRKTELDRAIDAAIDGMTHASVLATRGTAVAASTTAYLPPALPPPSAGSFGSGGGGGGGLSPLASPTSPFGASRPLSPSLSAASPLRRGSGGLGEGAAAGSGGATNTTTGAALGSPPQRPAFLDQMMRQREAAAAAQQQQQQQHNPSRRRSSGAGGAVSPSLWDAHQML